MIGTLNQTGEKVDPNSNTDSYWDLPTGKWSFHVNMLAHVLSTASVGMYWIRTGFARGLDNTTFITDCIGATFLSGFFKGGFGSLLVQKYYMLTGILIINNTARSTKRYLYQTL
jgi:hypothetical protein